MQSDILRPKGGGTFKNIGGKTENITHKLATALCLEYYIQDSQRILMADDIEL